MGTKSAFNKMSLPGSADAPLIPFGPATSLRMAAKGFARRRFSGVVPAAWVKLFLIFLTAGFWCLPLCGANRTNVIEFAKSLPKVGSAKWEMNHRLNQERQEVYRKRVAIPDAVGAYVPQAATASLINGQKNVEVLTPPPILSAGRFLKLLCFSAALVLTGFLLARRYAPQLVFDLNQRFNPWALP